MAGADRRASIAVSSQYAVLSRVPGLCSPVVRFLYPFNNII